MSLVTGVMLLASASEWEDGQRRVLDAVNVYLSRPGTVTPSKGLIDIESPGGWYGGTKALECCIAVGSFNYLGLDEFVAHLQTIRDVWIYPEDVQLLVKEQEDDVWRIILPYEESP